MTTHLQSEHIEAGLEARLSRRVWFRRWPGCGGERRHAALAEQTAVVAEATSGDYARDPTRWGSADSRPVPRIQASRHAHEGRHHPRAPWRSGPPLLLLHGYPNNHVLW